MNNRPKPSPFQLVCIALGAVAGSILGFKVLDGGALGGGVMGLCVFLGAIPYKKTMDAAK